MFTFLLQIVLLDNEIYHYFSLKARRKKKIENSYS